MTKRPIALPIALAFALCLPAATMAQEPLPNDEVPALPRPPDEDEVPLTPKADGAPAIDLPSETEGREVQLDALFDQLAAVEGRTAQVVQAQIWRVWRRSGSDAMNLLLRRGMEAIEDEDYDTALLHLDDLVRLAPDFAEGWNQRATAHFLRGDYGASMQDIEATLSLEPRHFGALAGLGIILDRTGYDAAALSAYRRALEVNPHLDGARKGVEKLSPEIDGRDL